VKARASKGWGFEAAERAARGLRRRIRTAPRVAIVLGTGMGDVTAAIRNGVRIPYGRIPGFARTAVKSHRGEMVFGELDGVPVAAMEGRFHFYEGHPPQQIAFPVRVLRRLGAEMLVVSGACGGMNPAYAKGDIALIVDHINLMGMNPLIGPNDERLGPRFPDMSAPYDLALVEAAEEAARSEGIRVHRAVYVAVAGPNLETRTEYRFLRGIGADIVGMSVVPEVLAAVHCGMRVFGVAVVTDVCIPETLEPLTVEDVIRVAQEASPKLARIVRAVVAKAGAVS
jgi:purine-nucleoside phosphorylase